MKGSNLGEQMPEGSAMGRCRFSLRGSLSDRRPGEWVLCHQIRIKTHYPPRARAMDRAALRVALSPRIRCPNPRRPSVDPGNFDFVIVTMGLVSVGPSSEALCTAFRQRNIHWESFRFNRLGGLDFRKRV